MSGLRKIIANNVIYDNASSGLTADTVQEAIDEISDASITINAKVNTFANLPAASLHNDQIYLVEQYSTGHLSGLYYSDGSNWTFRDDKITYSINAFTGTNKVLKVNSTSTKEIIETDIEIDSSNNLDLKAGGLKDSNVSTAVKLGSATDTSLTTTKKDILGGINENKSNIDLKANDNAVVHNTGNETIADVKTFNSFPITPSSAPTTDYQTANKKYVDDNFTKLDGSNAVFNTLSTTAKQNIKNLFKPDFSAGVSKTTVTTGWTADADGTVYVRKDAIVNGNPLDVMINGKKVSAFAIGVSNAPITSSCYVEIYEGQTMTYGTNVDACTFYPFTN